MNDSEQSTTTDLDAVEISAQDLAAMVDGRLDGNPNMLLRTLSPIEEGSLDSLTFIRAQSFARHWNESPCGAALVTEGVEVEGHNPDQRALIFVADADLAIVKILSVINPGTALPTKGIDKSATIDPSASIEPGATVGPGCVVCAGAKIESDVVLMANVYIGKDASIGEDSLLHPGVVIGDRVSIGARALIFANAVIGADGFGFLTATKDRPVTKVPQIGTVEIGDDVEIGALSSIDRAKFGVTRIGHRTKIDNQVHVGHNCVIGEDVLLCGRTTLGGSSTIGDRSMLGGGVILNDQAKVGKDVKVAGAAVVLDVIEDGETVLGVPAMPARIALANVGAQRNLAKFCRRVDKSLKKIDPDYKTV
jgi:UDP-3-O-[3-hydroxymyristoyl] glucosamine N-acyltransferase